METTGALARRSHTPGRGARTAAVAPAVAVRSPTVELAQVLGHAADAIADSGTSGERLLLAALSEVGMPSAPGAAAALVDRDGTEISRLRAFGVLHVHVLEVLGPREHARLLDLLDADADVDTDAGVDQAEPAPSGHRSPVRGCST